MNTAPTTHKSTAQSENNSVLPARWKSKLFLAVIAITLMGTIFAGPAFAQDDDPEPAEPDQFCEIEYVGDLVNIAFSVFIGGAIVLGVLTWVITSFAESLPLPQDAKQTVKRQRNSGIASMLRAVFGPALFIFVLDQIGVLPSCMTVLP